MKTYPIVIVTEQFDPHADALLQLLHEMGHDPARVHTADFPQQMSLSSAYSGGHWENTLRTNERIIPLDAVRSIWWRRPANERLPETLTRHERLFARAEVSEATIGLWQALEHTCYWVNFPANLRKASHKLSQLQEATRLGLQVPRALVSNNPDEVQEFYATCGRQMIFKTLSNPQPLVRQSAGLREQWKSQTELQELPQVSTLLIHEEELEYLDNIRVTPGFFEEYVPKRVELRVTVIGDEVFAAEIHSQVHLETPYGWQHNESKSPIYEHRLPVEIAEQCLALTRAYGLHFSTSEFIITPDGRYIFLEMHPNGQWLWIQERVPGLRMKEAMAACLIRGSNA